MKRVSVLLACLLLSGCIFKAKIHPGAINDFDSKTYDLLLVMNGMLTEAKNQYAAGKIPVSSKWVINNAGASYNIAREAWLAYRDAKTEIDRDKAFAAVAAVLPRLREAILELQKLVSKKTSFLTGRLSWEAC